MSLFSIHFKNGQRSLSKELLYTTMEFKNVQIRCSVISWLRFRGVGREILILVDRVRDMWVDGAARQMVEPLGMMAPGLSDSKKHFHFIDKIIHELSTFLLIHTQFATEILHTFTDLYEIFIVEMCSWCLERDYTYY